jgi:TM2 domain-containing membrane protein YozV
LVAASLSAVVPGVGQLYLGRRWRGWLMLGVSLVVIGIGFRIWMMGSVFMLKLLVQPSVLLALLVVDAVLLAFRLFAVLDAYRLGRPAGGADRRRRARARRYGGGAALVVLVGLTALPHLVAGYYDYLTYEMLTDVFAVIVRPELTTMGRMT